MTLELNNDTWVWVIVQEPETKAHYVGQFDQETGISYIPAFLQKDDAQQCLTHIVPDKTMPREVQAVCFGDLAHDAAQNGFTVFILNSKGRILAELNTPLK
jgi:hypothetical protein